MQFTKVEAGWYATPDGTYAVVVDGYTRRGSQDEQEYDGVRGREWALVHDSQGRLRESHSAGENLDWFDTKREAIAASGRNYS